MQKFTGMLCNCHMPERRIWKALPIVGAQAANELLNISRSQRSFFRIDRISTKNFMSVPVPIDEVNVQIIMEQMGGGGHLNMAGCTADRYFCDEADRNAESNAGYNVSKTVSMCIGRRIQMKVILTGGCKSHLEKRARL